MKCETESGIYCDKLAVNRSYELPNQASLIQVETFAIKQAVSIIETRKPHPSNLITCPDNQAVIKALISYLGEVTLG